MLAIGALAAATGSASAGASTLEPSSLARAQTIRAQLDARYRVLRGRGLAVTEATSTGVVESFALLTPDLLETRFLPADNGIYYAICPVRATCPYPARRFARPAAELVPRRLALELALRTFLETSADVVAVSLPTPRFILFVVEREELAREVDLATLAKALDRGPLQAPSSSLEVVVDRLTRPRIFVVLGLEPTPSGRDTLAAVPRWPTVSAGRKHDAPLAADWFCDGALAPPGRGRAAVGSSCFRERECRDRRRALRGSVRALTRTVRHLGDRGSSLGCDVGGHEVVHSRRGGVRFAGRLLALERFWSGRAYGRTHHRNGLRRR